MAVTANSIITPQAINSGTGITFTNADTTVAKTIATAGANGSICRGILATTDDTTLINCHILIGTIQIGTTRVAVASGNDGATVGVDLLNTTQIPGLKLDAAGNPILLIPPSATLKVGLIATMTSGKTLYLMPQMEDL